VPEIQHLNENLKIQARLYSELKQLAEVKQQALVKNNLHELEAVTVREEQLLLEAARLEKERLMWAEQIAQEMGKSPENITLVELAERYPQLKEVKADLENVITNLKEAHELNNQLLKQAIKVVDITLGVLTAQPSGNLYNRPGKKESEPTNSVRFLDKSI
jgi:flagellar biosynthesis/type III secretory pathway chaperone